MNMLRFPVFFYTMLFVAGHVLHAEFAVSADREIPDCMTPCAVQFKACFDKAKDSVNDIERELCDNERKECTIACQELLTPLQKEMEKEQQEKALLEQQERALLEERDKALLEQSDLTPEEQQKELLKLKRSRRVEKREQEEQESDATPPQDQSENAPQEQQGGEVTNGGIKVYEFK